MDYQQVLIALAAHYWGEQNHALSTPGKELRFGAKGSKSVDLGKATWFDHEADQGGGAADLVKFMEPGQSVADRLEQFGLPKQADKPRRETVWDYVDEQGEIRYQVVRYDQAGQKTYRQRQISSAGPVWNMAGVIPLPYRLPEILASALPVFICEGEKAADAVAALGLLATTNHGGAGKWSPALNDWFRGRHVVILPDNDEAGERHARAVADALTGTARTIRILRLPDLPPKGDAVDWTVMGGDRDTLTSLVMQTKAYDPLGAEPLPALPAPGPASSVASQAVKIELVHFDALVETKVRWLVDGLVPAQSFVALYGKPGSYKSFVALYLATMIATGREAFGRATEPADVIYVAGEGGAGLKARRDAIAKHYDLEPGTRIHFIKAQLNLRSTDADRDALIRAIEEAGLKPGLVIIDTLARAFGNGNENSSEDMGAFINHVGTLQAHLATAVMIVHHSGKDEAKGQRGHSSLLGAVDAELEVVKISDDDSPERVGEMRLTKQKDGEDGVKISYRMETVELSALSIDAERTSLAVVPAEAGAARPRKAKLSAGVAAVLDALQKAIDEGGQKANLPQIPVGAMVVKVNAWRLTYYAMSAQEADTKQKAFKRALDTLTHNRTIGVWADWCWISEA